MAPSTAEGKIPQSNQTALVPPSYKQEALVASQSVMVHAEQAFAQQQTMAPVVQYQDPDLHYPGTAVNQGVTVFVFGNVGTWKTTWAGQWPKAVFLSVGAEGGDDALAMLPSLYGVPAPPAYHITTVDMMRQKVEFIASNYRQLGINTVVIDSVTYYVDMWITEYIKRRSADPKVRVDPHSGELAMRMNDWGVLASHMRALAMRLHNTQLNVIWIALEKEVKEQDGQQGSSRLVAVEPFVRGETFLKLPGLCKMIIHANRELKPDMNVPGRMMIQPIYYTSPNYLTKIIRHKYGQAFPEGKLVDQSGGDIPTFYGIWSRIGSFVYMT